MNIVMMQRSQLSFHAITKLEYEFASAVNGPWWLRDHYVTLLLFILFNSTAPVAKPMRQKSIKAWNVLKFSNDHLLLTDQGLPLHTSTFCMMQKNGSMQIHSSKQLIRLCVIK